MFHEAVYDSGCPVILPSSKLMPGAGTDLPDCGSVASVEMPKAMALNGIGLLVHLLDLERGQRGKPSLDPATAGARRGDRSAFAPTSGVAVNAALPTSAGREHIGISIDTSALADSHVLVDCVRADFEEIASCTRTEPPRAPDERRHAVATCRPEPQ